MEPHIYALEMESMVAFGKHPSLLAFRELREAHGALQSFLEVLRPVNGDRKRLENGGFEAMATTTDEVQRIGREEESPRAPNGGIGSHVSLGVEVEEEDEDDDHKEEDDCRH